MLRALARAYEENQRSAIAAARSQQELRRMLCERYWPKRWSFKCWLLGHQPVFIGDFKRDLARCHCGTVEMPAYRAAEHPFPRWGQLVYQAYTGDLV